MYHMYNMYDICNMYMCVWYYCVYVCIIWMIYVDMYMMMCVCL